MAAFEKQWKFLTKSAALGKLSHAYLFSGPDGLGKKTLVLKFSHLVNCQDADEGKKPCGECPSCREFEKNCHPDFSWLESAEKGVVENEADLIRELCRWLSLRPSLGKYKILVINQFETFSAAAQSALLKTLEEPPGNAIIILVSRQPDLILPTIVSRVQEIRFYPWTPAQIREFLKELGTANQLAGQISFLSSGRPAKALLLKEPAGLRAEKERLTEFVDLGAGDLHEVFRKIKIMSEDREEAAVQLEDWLNFLRFVFLSKIGAEKDFAWPEISQKEIWPVEKMRNFLKAGQNTNFLLRRTNVSCQLALENLFLELN